MQLGIQPTEAWYTVVGSGPQILTGAVAENLETMQKVLGSDEWEELQSQLMEHVVNFQKKIVRATGRFQLP